MAASRSTLSFVTQPAARPTRSQGHRTAPASSGLSSGVAKAVAAAVGAAVTAIELLGAINRR